MFFSFFIQAQEIKNWGDPQYGCMVNGVPTLKCLEIIFSNFLVMSSIFIFLVLFIMFLVGSFGYLTSFGNAEKVKKAQGTLKFAVIGLILFLSAFLILRTIDVLFLGGNGNIFKFETQ